MADRKRVEISLIGGSQNDRLHTDHIKPPELKVAKNLFVSRSDRALTVRPDWQYSTEYDSIGDALVADPGSEFLNNAAYSVRSGYSVLFSNRMPFYVAAGTRIGLSSTYTAGRITTTGTGTTVVGSETSWLQSVWPGCLLEYDDVYYQITAVLSDEMLITEAPVPEAENTTYTIHRTHHADNAEYPIHLSKFTTQLIYSTPVPVAPLSKLDISGPWYMTFDSVDKSIWQSDPQDISDPAINITAMAKSVPGSPLDCKLVVGGSIGEAYWVESPYYLNDKGRVTALKNSSVHNTPIDGRWSPLPVPVHDQPITAIAYGITEAQDWTLVSVGSGTFDYVIEGLARMATNNSVQGARFLGCPGGGGDYELMTSTDPNSTWTEVQAGTDSSVYQFDVRYADGRWWSLQRDHNASPKELQVAWATDVDGDWTVLTCDDTDSSTMLNGAIDYSPSLGRWVCAMSKLQIYYSDDDFETWNRSTVDGTFQAGYTTIPARHMRYGGGVFIAAGPAGWIGRSTDGITWTSQSSGVSSILSAVAYSPELSRWVVCGTSGVVLTSDDLGSTWTEQASGAGTDSFLDCIWTGTQFVAAGKATRFWTSPDGITWTSTASSYNYAAGLAFNSALGIGVAADVTSGNNGDVYTWIEAGGVQLIVTGQDGTMHSTIATLAGGPDDDRHVRGGGEGWIITEPGGSWSGLESIKYINVDDGAFGAVGADGYIVYGDLFGWTATQANTDAVTLYDLDSDGTNVVVVGGIDGTDAVIMEAAGSDLTSWTARTSGLTDQSLLSVCYASHLDLWCAVGTGGSVYTSSDRTTWTSRTSGVSLDLLSVATDRGGHFFVAVGRSNGTDAPAIIYSLDGTNWSTHSPDSTVNGETCTCIVWDDWTKCFLVGGTNNVFFALQPGTYYTASSTVAAALTNYSDSYIMDMVCDGTNIWFVGKGRFSGTNDGFIGYMTLAAPGGMTLVKETDKILTAIDYDPVGGTFVAIGANGTCWSTTTPAVGGSWTERATALPNTLFLALEWDGYNFIASSPFVGLYISDGTTIGNAWTAQGAVTNQAVAFSPRGGATDESVKLVACSGTGIRQSPNYIDGANDYSWESVFAVIDWVDDEAGNLTENEYLGGNFLVASPSGIWVSNRGDCYEPGAVYRHVNPALSGVGVYSAGIAYNSVTDEFLRPLVNTNRYNYPMTDAVSVNGLTWSVLIDDTWCCGDTYPGQANWLYGAMLFGSLPVCSDSGNFYFISKAVGERPSLNKLALADRVMALREVTY